MAWTTATDPTNTNNWNGRCNQDDIFAVTPPEEPTNFATTGNLHYLEGFEFPATYYNGGDTSLWGTASVTGTPFSIVTTGLRGATVTAGHALQIVGTPTSAGRLEYHAPKGDSSVVNYQYLRLYIKIASYSNGNGFKRSIPLGGWTDSTGFRSYFQIILPANGSAPLLGVAHSVPGLDAGTDGTTALSTGVWYRCELVTERLTSGYTSTLNVFLDDTSTTFMTAISCHSSGLAMGGFPFVGYSGTMDTGNALTMVFDDMRVQTDSGTINVAALNAPLYGPGGIWTIYPSGAESDSFTPLSGTNFSNVDEFPLSTWDDDTSYVTHVGTGAATEYHDISVYPDTLPTDKYLTAVMLEARYKNPGGNTPTIKCVLVDGLTTVHIGSKQFTTSTGGYEIKGYIFLLYPLGLRSVFNSLQKIGYHHVTASPSTTLRVTSVWGCIDVAAGVPNV